MAVIAKTFRDFFSENFKQEGGYRYFRLNEMAERFHQMNSLPVNIDEEDLEFLRQFPHQWWIKAKQARYAMLFEKLKELHQKRHDPNGEFRHDELKKAIVKAMETGDYDHLKGVVPDYEIRHMQQTASSLHPRDKEENAESLRRANA